MKQEQFSDFYINNFPEKTDIAKKRLTDEEFDVVELMQAEIQKNIQEGKLYTATALVLFTAAVIDILYAQTNEKYLNPGVLNAFMYMLDAVTVFIAAKCAIHSQYSFDTSTYLLEELELKYPHLEERLSLELDDQV